MFASTLRLLQADSEWLKARLLDAALRGSVTEAEVDEYGRRYVLDFECERHDRCFIVGSAWIVRRGEDFPRLTTCYVLSE